MYIEIDDDLYNGFDDDLKSKLKEYKPEDTQALKDKANTLLSEKKAIQIKYDELQLDTKKKLSEAAEGGGDSGKIQSQLDDALAKLETSNNAYSDLQNQIKRKTLDSEAQKIANELTRDSRRAALLTEKISGRIDLDNENIVVLDGNGNQTISSVSDLTAEIKREYDFLVDGSQASGGGSQGGSGGAAKPSKKFNEYSGAELAAIRNESPENYEQLKKEFYN